VFHDAEEDGLDSLLKPASDAGSQEPREIEDNDRRIQTEDHEE
jgi:hypothetical protein